MKRKRRVLGVSSELSKAEVHWKNFLNSQADSGLHGVKMITSDAHQGLKNAREACFPTEPWQRCQFRLQQNTVQHCPKKSMVEDVTDDIRTIFNSPDKEEAERRLLITVQRYKDAYEDLSFWMEVNIPEY